MSKPSLCSLFLLPFIVVLAAVACAMLQFSSRPPIGKFFEYGRGTAVGGEGDLGAMPRIS